MCIILHSFDEEKHYTDHHNLILISVKQQCTNVTNNLYDATNFYHQIQHLRLASRKSTAKLPDESSKMLLVQNLGFHQAFGQCDGQALPSVIYVPDHTSLLSCLYFPKSPTSPTDDAKKTTILICSGRRNMFVTNRLV